MAAGELEPLRLSFTLLGTFDPDSVTERLGLTPTRTALRREGRQGVPKVAKDTWTLSKSYGDYFKTDQYIEDFWDQLIERSRELADVWETTEMEGVLSCVIWWDAEGSSPNIYLSEKAIAHLKELRLSFNVSLYLL